MPQIDCECIVDHKAAIDQYASTSPYGDPMPYSSGASEHNKLGFRTGEIATPTDSEALEYHEFCPCAIPTCLACTDVFNDSHFDLDQRTAFVARTSLLDIATTPQDDQLELLPIRVFGYALQLRRWYGLSILQVSDVKAFTLEGKAKSAFDELVLPSSHKRTIQALVKHQTRDFRETSRMATAGDNISSRSLETLDLVRGKGRGVIILLHGAPGVGKTSTAESVAVQLKRPLLSITCGDLGTDAYDVERRLESFLALGARWGCVVLLDEADVFMAKRVTGDLRRNSLVSGKWLFLLNSAYHSCLLQYSCDSWNTTPVY